MAASAAHGHHGLKYDPIQNWILGLEVVLPSGKVIRTGSKAPRSSCGYDLIRLFTGSEGPLGVITELTLRVIPLPQDRAVIGVFYDDLKEAMSAVSAIISFGDRRKLAVATAIAIQPEVLIFDEPTTAQDYEGRYKLAEIAKEMNKKGVTVIMITHDMDLVAKFAERVIVLCNGEILLDGPTAKVFAERELLRKAFITPPSISYLAQELHEYGVSHHILSIEEFLEILEVKE
jgi:hypothetical protein